MAAISKTILADRENYGATSEEIKSYGYDHYRVYMYSRYDYSATDYTMYANIPSAAQNIHLHFYVENLVISGTSSVKINGADVNVSSGWNDVVVSRASSYVFFVGVKRGWEVQYPGPWYYTIFGKNAGAYAPYITYDINGPEISGITLTDTSVDKDITVSWTQAYVSSWTLNVKKNNAVIATKTGTTTNSCTFSAGELQVGDAVLEIIATGNGETITETKNVTLDAPQPSVSTIQVSNLQLDKPIVITATRTNVDSWEVQAIQNSVAVCSKKGIDDISATFNVGDIKSTGDTIFRVIGYNTWYSTTSDKNVTLTAPPISVSDFSVTGTNIDEKISCSANGINVYNWTVQAIQNGIVKATKTGTGNTINCDFNGGEIRLDGETEFKLTYSNTWESKSISKNVALSKVEPLIIALEPNGVTANKDNIITVSWTANNQQKFDLTVDGNNYSGTTAQRVNIPIGAIKSLGQKIISLTITYTSSWGEVRKHSKTVTFIASGTPRKPILDDYSYYDVALPTFTFESPDAYNQYQVQVLDSSNEVIDDSGLISGHDGTYTCQTTLENETVYKVRVRVRTPYGYWSAWAAKTFTTAFIMAEKPSISIVVSKNSIVINSFTKYTQPFDYCDIYRRTENSKWVRIAHNLDNNISFTDRYVGKELYYYKVSSVSTSGGVNDSEILSAKIDINNFNFVDIEDIENGVEFFGNPEVEITDVFESVANEYAGVFAPIYEDGEHNYRVGRCSFLCEKPLYDKFKAMISKAKVIMYRDCRGEKIYCKVYGNIPRSKFEENWITISFEFTEVPFVEKDLFIGYGNTSNIFWDGTYKWDGSIYWDGDSVPETQVYSAYGNQKLTFHDGEYQWVPKE